MRVFLALAGFAFLAGDLIVGPSQALVTDALVCFVGSIAIGAR
jgi:hypothetical protein